jgi:hypothetical protein
MSAGPVANPPPAEAAVTWTASETTGGRRDGGEPRGRPLHLVSSLSLVALSGNSERSKGGIPPQFSTPLAGAMLPRREALVNDCA